MGQILGKKDKKNNRRAKIIQKLTKFWLNMIRTTLKVMSTTFLLVCF